MTWASLLTALVKLAGAVAAYLRDKQLLDAGRAQATAKFTGQALENVNEANRARITAADDGVFRDPFDAANRHVLPDPAADPVRQPGDTG